MSTFHGLQSGALHVIFIQYNRSRSQRVNWKGVLRSQAKKASKLILPMGHCRWGNIPQILTLTGNSEVNLACPETSDTSLLTFSFADLTRENGKETVKHELPDSAIWSNDTGAELSYCISIYDLSKPKCQPMTTVTGVCRDLCRSPIDSNLLLHLSSIQTDK